MDVSRLSPLYLTAASVQEPWDTSSADSNQSKLAAKHSLGSTISEGGLRNGYISGLGVDRSCTLKCGCIITDAPVHQAQEPASMKTEQDQLDENLL